MTYGEDTARTLVEARWRAGLALHAAQEAVRILEKMQGAPLCDVPPLLEKAADLAETIEYDCALALADYHRLIRKVQGND